MDILTGDRARGREQSRGRSGGDGLSVGFRLLFFTATNSVVDLS